MLQGAPADSGRKRTRRPQPMTTPMSLYVGECRGARTPLCGGPVDTSVRRARRGIPDAARSPGRHQQKSGVGRPLPHRTPRRRLAQVALGAGRARLLIALLGLAPGEASEATKPWAALVRAGAYQKRPPISPAADPIAIVKKNSAAAQSSFAAALHARARVTKAVNAL